MTFDYPLHDDEIYWTSLQPFLLARGYQLRARYQPGWVGSWIYNGKTPLECEDSRCSRWWNIIDAIRVSDNVKVALKLVRTTTEQIPIALYLSSEPLLSDARNRTVRFLDVITIPDDDAWAILVMPHLREFDDPPFQHRIECVEVLRQLLEGLEFMHEQNVAHRDACRGNFMMDSTNMIPSGFHHVLRDTDDGIFWSTRSLTIRSRLSVAPVEYFFIDFGLSSRFSNVEGRQLVTGIFGRDKTVPELSDSVPYDPFKVDIYQAGGIIHQLVETYHGLSLFRPLAVAMMRQDPAQRPTASEALSQFERIVSPLGPRAMKARVVLYKKWLPAKTWRAIRKPFRLIAP